MVRVRYTGLHDPKRAFDELRPYREQLIRMAGAYFPFSEEYCAIHEAREALDRVAARFTGDPEFYSLKPHSTSRGDTQRER